MSCQYDQEALLLLLKAPKKKYIKKLIELAICLNLTHNCSSANLQTPVTQNFKADLELTAQQWHSLLQSISNLVEACCLINFDFENHQLLSESFDEQLKEMILNTIGAMQADIQEVRANSMKSGSTIVDVNWKVDVQVVNEKGKINTPSVILQIESARQGELNSTKVFMRGEQFMAFFGNLKKIKDQLVELVNK